MSSFSWGSILYIVFRFIIGISFIVLDCSSSRFAVPIYHVASSKLVANKFNKIIQKKIYLFFKKLFYNRKTKYFKTVFLER